MEVKVRASASHSENTNNNSSSGNVDTQKEDMRIHSIAINIAKISLFVSVANTIYDIVMLAMNSKLEILAIGITQTVLNITSSLLFVISTLIATLYGSRTMKRITDTDTDSSIVRVSIIQELLHRYKHSNLKKEALRINELMENTIVSSRSELYDCVQRFRGALRKHLVKRMGLSSAISIIMALFLYFNTLFYLILYSGYYSDNSNSNSNNANVNVLSAKSARFLYFSLNIANPIVCSLFSYIVVLCDNFHSAVEYASKVHEAVNSTSERNLDKETMINDLRECIERPLFKQLFEVSV
jgi:hypothetical protein